MTRKVKTLSDIPGGNFGLFRQLATYKRRNISRRHAIRAGLDRLILATLIVLAILAHHLLN